MKKIFRALRFLAVWFITTFMLLICFAIILPADETGQVNLSNFHVLVLIVIPIALGVLTLKMNAKIVHKHGEDSQGPASPQRNLEVANPQKEAQSSSESFKIPRTKKKQMELAERLLENINVCVSLANKSDRVDLFIKWYDEAINDLSNLMQLEKATFKVPPVLDYYRLKDELQWHLCDAIVRAKEKTVSDIKGKYQNSREFQERTLKSFEDDIGGIRSRFSDGTATLADESIQEIQRLLGFKGISSNSKIDAGLSSVDFMDGHSFEYWCADLLRKNGFTDVEVTKGSGDQGVDVLAEKGGIKYAIQCKCYSSDLGNTPVQEVNTGKTIYHCQIGVVMTNRYFTQGAKDAAVATGVLLWDRDKLQEMIEKSGN